VGRELNVGFVVDGMVQSAGTQLRLSARLVEVATGTQLWSERFEDSAEDPFELQDRLSQRVAEALRLELLIAAWSHAATPEVLTLFRQAVLQGTSPSFAPELTQEWIDTCVQQAPGFLPGLSHHALLSMRMLFMRSGDTGRNWVEEARASLTRAERQVPEHAETHLARALLAGQDGDWRKAVFSARAALAAAPTFAAAMQYLGALQCEAGRAEEGLVHLRRAYSLNPRLSISLIEFARCSALRGRMEDYRWACERLATFPSFRSALFLLRVRFAAWTNDREALLRWQRELEDESIAGAGHAARYAAVVLGKQDPSTTLEATDALLARKPSPRFAALLCQIATEELCLTGHADKALTYFLLAADNALIDLEWTDRCPVLTPLRALPGFSEGRKKVRARVEAIWSA
jgi:serine/threonine-protein kinase